MNGTIRITPSPELLATVAAQLPLGEKLAGLSITYDPRDGFRVYANGKRIDLGEEQAKTIVVVRVDDDA